MHRGWRFGVFFMYTGLRCGVKKMRVGLDGWPPSQALPDCHPFLQGAHLEGDGLAVVDGVVVLDEHREHVLRPTCEAGVIHHEYLLFGLGLRVQKAM